MPTESRKRPARDEYHEFYDEYVSLVPDGDVVAILKDQRDEVLALLDGLPAEKHDHRYAPGKWSIKQVLGHLIDTERIFAFRALHIARGDAQPLPGMDQDEWMATADFGRRPLASLLDEYGHLRSASIGLFEGFDEEVLGRVGTANDVRFTVRTFPYIMAGHERHHVEVLKERYL
ncbi:MAG: DinB family protein [Planctomycetota bacterium]|nr:DinB family protein [Planctomycetota bacterium]